MALRYGYFDSEITGVDENGMPVFDRAESSDLFRLLFANLLRSGVLASPGDCFQVLAGSGLTVRVRPGFAVINGSFAYDSAEAQVTIPTADSNLPRIDRIVLRCNYLNRLCELIVKTGTPASTPVAPSLLQPASGDYYELGLATVRVEAGAASVSQSAIADTRADSRVCGYITQLIDHIDTSVFMEQLTAWYAEYTSGADSQLDSFFEDSASAFNTWFDGIRDQLSDDAAGNLQNQINDLSGTVSGLSARTTTVEEDTEELSLKVGSGTLNTTASNLIGAVNELLSKLGTATYNTSAKNAVGAVNELLSKINTNINNIASAVTRIGKLETKTQGIAGTRQYAAAAGASAYVNLEASSVYLIIVSGWTISTSVMGMYVVGATTGAALGIKAISSASSVALSDTGNNGILKIQNNGSVTLRISVITLSGFVPL